jgi:hypothetical protein
MSTSSCDRLVTRARRPAAPQGRSRVTRRAAKSRRCSSSPVAGTGPPSCRGRCRRCARRYRTWGRNDRLTRRVRRSLLTPSRPVKPGRDTSRPADTDRVAARQRPIPVQVDDAQCVCTPLRGVSSRSGRDRGSDSFGAGRATDVPEALDAACDDVTGTRTNSGGSGGASPPADRRQWSSPGRAHQHGRGGRRQPTDPRHVPIRRRRPGPVMGRCTGAREPSRDRTGVLGTRPSSP